ncbi:hypothetical protein [Streptomyces lunalinharesii]
MTRDLQDFAVDDLDEADAYLSELDKQQADGVVTGTPPRTT